MIHTFFSAKKYQKALATASSLTLSSSQETSSKSLKIQNSASLQTDEFS